MDELCSVSRGAWPIALHRVAPHVPVSVMSGYQEGALAEVKGLQLEADFVFKAFARATSAKRGADKLGAMLAASHER